MIKEIITIKPNALSKNQNIYLVAPAGPIAPEQLLKARQKLENFGFNVYYSPKILERHGYLAGKDHVRLKDFHHAFEDKNIQMVLCIRGGYGSARIVDDIDFELIKRNPKLFMGFSDITVLLNAIHQKTGLVTFHGIIGNSAFTEYSIKSFNNSITRLAEASRIMPFDEKSIHFINKGKASGKLVGGNLSLVSSLIGTAYEIDLAGNILFLEDIDEPPYKIDRMLSQMLLTGKLQKAKGIILGDFTYPDSVQQQIDSKKSLSLNEVLLDRLGNLNIPVMAGFSFGHIENQAVFPIGIQAEIDSTKTYIKLLENAVS